MSSKAEKISHRSDKQPSLSIFFRNPLLLKIVAWLGSLSFIGVNGIAWADLKPISTSQPQIQERVEAPVTAANPSTTQTYGPYLPIVPQQSLDRVTAAQLPNREVPIAVAPGSASILPTGKIIRPQHTDVMGADNYTVGVNGSATAQTTAAEFIDIPVPAPLRTVIPSQVREAVSISRSQVRPSYVRPQTANRATPITVIQPQTSAAYRTVPTVASLPTTALPSQIGRSSTTNRTLTATAPSTTRSQRLMTATPSTSSAKFRPAVLTQMRPAVTRVSVPTQPQNSIAIGISPTRTQRVEVRPVAQLPPVETKVVPTVPAIPTVRPTAAGNDGNELSAQLIYPLSSPAPTTSSFGWRTHPITGSRRFHSGVDIGAPMGAPVVAAGSGTIVSAGWFGGYGKAIVIQHNGVQQTLYGHLSEVFVQPGQKIEQGTVIGRVGSTGNSTGPHLHFEARVATADGWVAIDPGEDIKYALEDLRRSMPFAQRELPSGFE
jgi:murein DD-endopeptidase MepM/ murein hydrolase activator NlpD